MRALVFNQSSVKRFRQLPTLAAEWYTELSPLPPEYGGVEILHLGDTAYLLADSSGAAERRLVIALGESGLFGGVARGQRANLLDRCLRFAIMLFDGGKLPPSWKPYHTNNLVSFFAFPSGRGTERIVAELDPDGSSDVFVAAFSDREEVYKLDTFRPDLTVYRAAVAGYEAARQAIGPLTTVARAEGQVDLDEDLPRVLSHALTYEDWLKQLSPKQAEFVAMPVRGPIKLRGAAGTGKTLAMVLKALKLLYEAVATDKAFRGVFITHSWAVAELADRLMTAVDSRGAYRRADTSQVLEVAPLLAVVEDELGYRHEGIQTLGSDSFEGKKLQLEELAALLGDFKARNWIGYRGSCSQAFRERVESDDGSRAFKLLLWDILIEFGCVLGAQRIRQGAAGRRDRYLKMKRTAAMMRLPDAGDRATILHLYDEFLGRLRARHVMTSDQLVNDYLGRLFSFYWDRVRAARGYDVVFVDELHLFNDQERLVFHQLTREESERPAVVMALDPKQSPRETFLSLPDDQGIRTDIYSRAELSNPEEVVLTQVFRYTPEITALVHRLDESFPALELGSDWGALSAESRSLSGPKPTLRVVENAARQFDRAATIARAAVSGRGGKGARVAVLTLDSDRFDSYCARSDADRDFLVITSREDGEKLRYAGRRFVLSQPEYVAGLQFDTVVLIDVNRDLAHDPEDSGYTLRRFLSELYLGITRAERVLECFATEDMGGPPSVVAKATEHGLLERKE